MEKPGGSCVGVQLVEVECTDTVETVVNESSSEWAVRHEETVDTIVTEAMFLLRGLELEE